MGIVPIDLVNKGQVIVHCVDVVKLGLGDYQHHFVMNYGKEVDHSVTDEIKNAGSIRYRKRKESLTIAIVSIVIPIIMYLLY